MRIRSLLTTKFCEGCACLPPPVPERAFHVFSSLQARSRRIEADRMPDPQVLYVVTAVVVLALVAWVIAVLTRTGDARDMTKGAGPIPATAGGPPTAAGPELSEPTSKTLPADPPADLKSGR